MNPPGPMGGLPDPSRPLPFLWVGHPTSPEHPSGITNLSRTSGWAYKPSQSYGWAS